MQDLRFEIDILVVNARFDVFGRHFTWVHCSQWSTSWYSSGHLPIWTMMSVLSHAPIWAPFWEMLNANLNAIMQHSDVHCSSSVPSVLMNLFNREFQMSCDGQESSCSQLSYTQIVAKVWKWFLHVFWQDSGLCSSPKTLQVWLWFCCCNCGCDSVVPNLRVCCSNNLIFQAVAIVASILLFLDTMSKKLQQSNFPHQSQLGQPMVYNLGSMHTLVSNL